MHVSPVIRAGASFALYLDGRRFELPIIARRNQWHDQPYAHPIWTVGHTVSVRLVEVLPQTNARQTTPPTVTDSANALRDHSVMVGEAFSVTLPAADPGSGSGGPYDYNLWHQGRQASFTNGVDGLTFDPATRTLSGTPARAGVYLMSYVIHDGDAERARFDAFRERMHLRVTVTGEDGGEDEARPRSIAWGGKFWETAANDGSVEGVIAATLTGDTFTEYVVSGRHVTVTNLPAGLTAVLERTSDTTVTLQLTGNADAHGYYDYVRDVTVAFGNGAFAGGDAGAVTGAGKADISIQFDDPPDRAPTVSDTAAFTNHEATVGEPFSLVLPAADAGSGSGGPYKYILWKRGAGVEFGENGLTFDPATRTLSGTPAAPGAFDLAYQVHDGDANRSKADSFVEESALRITVSAAAVPAPVVAAGGAPTVSDTAAFANHEATVGEPFSLVLPAADAGSGSGGPYEYILWKRGAGVFGENGLTFDPATRTVSGTPQAAGAHELAYQVHDGDADRSRADSFVEETALRITVAAAPPVVAPGGAPTVSDTAAFTNHEATVGEPFSLVLPAADEGSGSGGPYEYILWKRNFGIPFGQNGLSFDPATRTLSGTPEATWVYYLAYQVHDGDADRSRADSFVEETALQITVTATAPTVSDTTAFANHEATVGEPFNLVLPAADADSGSGGPYKYILWKRGARERFEEGVRFEEGEQFGENGLSFDAATRTVSGKPLAVGVHELAYQIHDGDANGFWADSFFEGTALQITVTAAAVLGTSDPVPCVADLGAFEAGAEAVSRSGKAWNAPECRAHHRENRPARYFEFTLEESATVSLALTSDSAASLFVSAGTPGNGWGTPPGSSMEHRLATRGANGKLVHEGGLAASLALEPGSYTAEAVLEEDGANPAASFFALTIAASAAVPAPVADTAPTVSDSALFANHEATVGEAFSLTLPAADAGSGNGGPYEYILWKRGAGVEFGENGLTFDPATRTLSGTPAAPGAFDLAYQVHDGDANRSGADSFVEESALRIVVSAAAVPEPVVAAGGAPTVSDTSAFIDHPAFLGQPFSVTLPAADAGSGDGGPYDYNLWHRGAAASFTAGIDGLTFDAASRTLSGTPERAGVYRMSYVVHDGDADRTPADAFRERERLRVTVRAPPVLSVADARANESDGAIAFTLTLDTPAPVRATVAWATADGTATAGSDYTAAGGTAVFAPGATEATVSVAILDDAHDEGEETFRLVLSDPVNLRIGDGEAIGTIVNSDPLLNAWLARFGRSVAGQTVEALTERFAVPPGAGSHVTLGGQRLALTTSGTGAPEGGGEADAASPPEDNAFAALAAAGPWDGTESGRWNGSTGLPGSGVIPGSGAIPGSPGAAESRSITGREFLLGSSFHLTTEGKEPGSGRWTAWGRAALESFSGEDGGLSVDGEVVTGVFGADWDAGRWLGGVALTHSVGEGDLSSEGLPLDYGVKSTVTAVNPYLRLRLTDRVTAWGLAGYGGGGLDLTVKREASGDDPASTETYRTDLTMMLGAVGARGELVTPDESGGYGLALRGDAFWVRTESDAVSVGDGRLAASQGDASRARVTLEGSRRVELEGGGTLTPSLELGLRQDGGDAETGTGLEAGGGIAYADPSSGFSADLRARTLVAHAESGYREWGLSGAVKLQPGGAAGRGLSFSLLPAFGADAGGDRLWSARDAAALAPANGNAHARGRLETELGYGLPAFDGGFTGTPYLGFGYSDTERKYRLGWRLTRAADPGSFQFSLETSRRESANDNEPEHGIGFRATARW